MHRRAFLAAGMAVGTAGCLQFSETDTGTEGSTETESPPSETTAEPTATATEEPTETPAPTLDELACPADRSLSGAPTDDWGQPQSDAASTGYVAEETVGTSSACIVWRQENLGRASSAVVLSDSFVFTGGDGGDGLRASDRTTGEQAWTTKEQVPETYNVRNPLVVGETVYFTADVRGDGGHVFALDAETGREQWRMKPVTDAGNMGVLRADGRMLYGTSLIENEGDNAVAWAVDTTERTTRWQTALTGRRILSCSVGDGRVYFGGDNDATAGVQALDADTGEVLWRAIEAQVAGAPTPTADAVYATTNDTPDAPTLFALDPETGDTQWTYETLNGTDGSVVVADDTVTFSTPDGLFCLGTDGTGIWRYDGQGSRTSRGSPVRVGETVLVGSSRDDSGLLAVDATSGEPQWFVPTPAVPMTPAVVDGDIYAMYRTEDDWAHHLMALRTA